MKKKIEKNIREFINSNYQKDYADRTVDLPNGWTMRMVYYDSNGYGFTDVIINHESWRNAVAKMTIKAECDIEPAACGVAECVEISDPLGCKMMESMVMLLGAAM